jgi:molecular chaperone GrpE (heat shock protein)
MMKTKAMVLEQLLKTTSELAISNRQKQIVSDKLMEMQTSAEIASSSLKTRQEQLERLEHAIDGWRENVRKLDAEIYNYMNLLRRLSEDARDMLGYPRSKQRQIKLNLTISKVDEVLAGYKLF